MSYTPSASARFANLSVLSIKAQELSSCMKLNQVGGVESLTRDQNKVHSALSFHAAGER
jgi:hypothetical protein